MLQITFELFPYPRGYKKISSYQYSCCLLRYFWSFLYDIIRFDWRFFLAFFILLFYIFANIIICYCLSRKFMSCSFGFLSIFGDFIDLLFKLLILKYNGMSDSQVQVILGCRIYIVDLLMRIAESLLNYSDACNLMIEKL